ncbi:MAG: hypothetical protein C4293_09915 [Nitrospiraceae bacterium]
MHFVLIPALPFLFCLLTWPAAGIGAGPQDVFGGFTSHIHHQVQSDKQTFVKAQTCVELFYKQLYEKPSKPKAEGISYAPSTLSENRAVDSECRTHYPDGLESARKDFSLRQSSLSVSLTFYEFALVGDRDDDAWYSETELRDMLESFGLTFNAILPATAHLAVLTAQFDAVHRAGNLDALMAGMGILYDRGYRFTDRDRVLLDQISG